MQALIERLTKQYDGFYADNDWEITSDSVAGMVKFALYHARKRLGDDLWNILDVGCGKGHFSHAFAVNSEAQVVGIDLSMEAIMATDNIYDEDNLAFWCSNVMEYAWNEPLRYDLIYIRAFSLFNKKHSSDNDIHCILDHISKLMSDNSVMIIDEWTDFSGEIKKDGYYKGWHQRTGEEITECYLDYTPIRCITQSYEPYPLWNNTQMGYMVIYERHHESN